ncbi:hypothetical protein [Thaumasiovibrio subtropicus]|uniref:hypothetical protein n=2 Tax=Thaumasiovibrio subtropicus TaxID=1891207 RepID=UPI001C846C6A|nr:hypothetical protein [Thaumasiovibrio subtropicus]
MINNIDELKLYTDVEAAKFPTIASHIRLGSSNYSEEQIAELSRRIPELPLCYIRVVRQVELTGVSIGQFALWPVTYGSGDLLTCLTKANESCSNPFLGFYSNNYLVEVACCEANTVCIGSAAGRNEGQVFLVDISSGPNPVFLKLAENFEQFLILAGNLHDISMSYQENENSGLIEFSSRLEKFELDSSSVSTWIRMLEEELF